MTQNKKIDKYAKVLFSVFKENNAHESGSKILDILSRLLDESPQFKQFALTKRIDLNLKKEILSTIFTNVFNESDISLVFCLLENIDFKYLGLIKKKYQKLMLESSGCLNVTAVTVNKLSDSELSDLKNEIKAKINSDITINNVVDKAIIGGVKLQVGNTLIDGSISTRLEKLKQSMINK